MNRLITTYTGGMPDHLDNFRWYEDAVKTAFKDIVKGLGLGDDMLILYGVDVTQNSSYYFVSEGAIFMNGEIFKVPAHQLSRFTGGQTGTYYWEVFTSNDPSGNLTFQNQISHQVYEIREVKLTKTTSILTPGSYTPLEVKGLAEVLTARADFDALADSHALLLDFVNYWKHTNGVGYYMSELDGPSQSYSNHQDVVFDRVTGSLSGDTHITLRAGGVYKITLHEGASLDIRLSGGLGNIFPLNDGVNFVLATSLNANQPVPDINATFQWLQNGNVVISVELLGVDYSLTGGVEDIPDLGG